MRNILMESISTLSDTEITVIAKEYERGVPEKRIVAQLLEKSNRDFSPEEVARGKDHLARFIIRELAHRFQK